MNAAKKMFYENQANSVINKLKARKMEGYYCPDKESAKAKGLEVKTVKATMKMSGRYLAEVEKGDGFCKLVIDTKKNCLVGCHMIGSYTSEMIYGAALMIEKQMPIEQIKELVFPHPTVSEVIREALFL